MPTVTRRWALTERSAADLRSPRADVVLEEAQPDGTYSCSSGPFRTYRRTLKVDESAGTAVETTTFRLDIPYFSWLFTPLVRRAIHAHRPGMPWWSPPDRLTSREARVLATLAVASLVVGYVNTLLTQTITFAADEFGSSDAAQGVSLAVVRVGIVFALLLAALADRRGRRRVILLSAVVAPVVAALGALSPGLAFLTATQAVARPVALALGIAVSILSAEEMPRNSRAYAVSLLALATGLGAGLAVLALPLADLGAGGWRLVYVIPLVFLLLVPGIARRLPESHRFEAPHAEHVTLRGHRGRFALLGVSGLLINLLVAPASGFQNRYLSRVRGYSASRIAAFTVATNTPGGVGVLAGGRLADTFGRKRVGAIALLFGSFATIMTFWVGGWGMWAWAMAGAIVGGMAVPALGVYTAELFPTGLRGRANGWITVLSLVGSSIGLVAAGWMLDQGRSYGAVMALLGSGAVLVAALVLGAYPETAHHSLEEINPEDDVAAAPDAHPSPPAR